ncbi:CadC family transcriptional regulator [Klebsiella aerogenes]|uniref:winged helix-turn-helix domain-containing protein n=1 Tax=Klebsiella TaxID=570 RepID=UPI0007B3230B|nr:winged helix-turn-helix domain-containing protein [Klebsiella aerogenes]EKW1038175.1 winged helix-turn-helix domain-containing protein [Klebsiella aerogenes]ELA1687391.1 winged helix-turn-helix domain-containing protein [Klebsiella aerogenes]ELW9545335.1 winged helix-turn-helix domain-containing protein [Klebsiella aerogenes]KZR00310.1 CadC family transcriptional regulator [Klebsiella aerogenes]QDR55946.1 CadC family transcriptional regulator [Klebsiella aerogenes]
MIIGSALLGYQIGEDVFYFLKYREIATVSGIRKNIRLRKTMACLIEYLFEHGRERIVSDEELMVHVWEANNLRPSSQRLWQVMQNLRRILKDIGIANDVILRVKSQGYSINSCYVTGIYSIKNNHSERVPGL